MPRKPAVFAVAFALFLQGCGSKEVEPPATAAKAVAATFRPDPGYVPKWGDEAVLFRPTHPGEPIP